MHHTSLAQEEKKTCTWVKKQLATCKTSTKVEKKNQWKEKAKLPTNKHKN
jgi:hypothetical protein